MNANAFETFAGLSLHTWIDRPDTKFNADGLYKTKLIGDLADPKVAAFKQKVDDAAAAALEDETKDLTPGQKKKWEPYLPYTLETDDTTGEDTGRIIFEFKRNAKVTLRATGEVKELSVAVYDSKGKPVLPPPPIYSGSTIKVVGNFRPIKIAATNKAGVRMDFFAVKVLKMQKGKGDSPFSDDEVADGWEANEADNSADHTTATDGDY